LILTSIITNKGGRPAISGLSVTLQTLEASYVITQIVVENIRRWTQLVIDTSPSLTSRTVAAAVLLTTNTASIVAKSIETTLINIIEYTLQGFVLNRPKYDRLGYENLNAHHKWVYKSLHTMHVDIYNQNEMSRDQMVNLTEWAYNANNDYITCIANYLASGMGNVAKGHEVKSCASILPPDDLFTYSADELSNTRRRALRERDASSFDPQWNGTLSEKIDAMEEQLKLCFDSQDSSNQTDYTSMLDAIDKKMTALDKKLQSNQQDISTFHSQAGLLLLQMDHKLQSNQQNMNQDINLTMYGMEMFYNKSQEDIEWVYNANNDYQACLTNMILTSIGGEGADGVAVYECTPESFGTIKQPPDQPTNKPTLTPTSKEIDCLTSSLITLAKETAPQLSHQGSWGPLTVSFTSNPLSGQWMQDGRTSIGTLNKVDGNKAFFFDGEYCQAINADRSGIITFTEDCSSVLTVTSINEPKTCHYEMNVNGLCCSVGDPSNELIKPILVSFS